MDYINDFIGVYKNAIKDTILVIKKVPLLPFLPLFFSLIYMAINYILLIVGIGYTRIWGFISGLILALLLSSMFYQLRTGITEYRLYRSDLQKSFTIFMWPAYYIIFAYWIINLLLGRIIISNLVFELIYSFGIFILFNAVGETIYFKGTNGLDSFIYSATYLFENLHLWLPHVLVYMGLKKVFLGFVPSIYQIYFDSTFFILVKPLLVVSLIIEGVYIVFRGVLFKNTMDSSVRKRKYMGVFE